MTQSKFRERAEIACGLLWFVLDGCWMMDWRLACYVACLLAAFAAYLVMALTERKSPVTMWVCAADTAWIYFNILWAVGDLSGATLMISLAKVLFFGGGVCYVVALMIADDARELVLRPLRFLASLVRS